MWLQWVCGGGGGGIKFGGGGGIQTRWVSHRACSACVQKSRLWLVQGSNPSSSSKFGVLPLVQPYMFYHAQILLSNPSTVSKYELGID